MSFVRFLLGVLVAIGALLLAVPTMVLIDLVSGGTGLGLCPSGLGTCTTSVFTMAELVVIFGIAGLLVVAGIAGCVRLLRTDRQRSMDLG